MKTNILICGNTANEPDILKDTLPADEVTIRSCIPDEEIIMKELSENEHNSVLLFVSGSRDRWCRIIKNIRSSFPDIKIFAGAACAPLSYIRELRDAGADLCMILPASIKIFSEMIYVYMRFCDDSRVPVYIACFLCQYGFLSKNTGFVYLCSAIELCLKDPGCLEALYDKIYGIIAERYSVQPELVERMLRRTASASASDGTLAAVTGEDEHKITSHDLIAVLCEAYVRERFFII